MINISNILKPKIISNERLYANTYLMWLESPELASIARPGQFMMIKCGNHLLRRPLAIHQVCSNNDQIAILFAVVGKGTNWLSSATAGQHLDVLGPLGNNFELYNNTQNLLIISGGMGVAPLYFLAQESIKMGKSVVLLQGAANSDCVYPEEILPHNVRCYIATEDGSKGLHCLVTGILPEYIDWADQLVACGPVNMYHAIARQNDLLTLPKPFQISLEERMGCGFGVCSGCSVLTVSGTKKVCSDGPVFDYCEITWDQLL